MSKVMAKRSRLRFLLLGYFGHGNLGDEMMLGAFLSGMRGLAEFDAAVISGDAGETRRTHAVMSIHKFNMLAIAAQILGSDATVGCGGSLLQDATSFRSLLYYASLLLLSRCLGSKAILLAQGLGPLRRQVSRRLASLALRSCSLLTFRDTESFELALKLGAERDKVHLTSDLAFIIEPPFEAAPPSGQIGLSIAVRDWRGAHEVAKCIAQGVLTFTPRISSVRCISLSREDEPLSEWLCEQLGSLNAVHIAPTSICDLWKAIDGVHLLIGVRLHSLIAACMVGVPTIAISYDPKVKAFMNAFAPRLCIPWDEVSAERIVECIVECLDGWSKLHEAALQFALTSRALSKRNLTLLLDALP